MNALGSNESPTITKSNPSDLEETEEFWVREMHRRDGTSGRFGEAMLDAADLKPGQKVLDVGPEGVAMSGTAWLHGPQLIRARSPQRGITGDDLGPGRSGRTTVASHSATGSVRHTQP